MPIVEVDPQGPDALALLPEAVVEARALYPEWFPPGSPWPTNGPTPAGGSYVVAYDGDRPVACGALRPLDGQSAEVRRMFVTRDARRQGWASAVLAELERRALGLAYGVLRLETGCRQAPAMALYRSRGFIAIPPFGAYADDPTSVCFEKPLDGRRPGSPGPVRTNPPW